MYKHIITDSRDSGSTAGRLIGPEKRETENESWKREVNRHNGDGRERWRVSMCQSLCGVSVTGLPISEQNKTATCKFVVGLLGWREEGSTTAHKTKMARKTPENTTKVKTNQNDQKTQAPAIKNVKKIKGSKLCSVAKSSLLHNTETQHPKNQPFFH